MSLSLKLLSISCLGAFVGLIGCSADTTDDGPAPSAESFAVEGQQSITYNGFTLTPSVSNRNEYIPYFGNKSYAWASVVISGGTGTQKQGVCLLNVRVTQNAPYNFFPCNSTADCPAVFNTGNLKYCLAPNNSGQKYCMERWGGQSSACAGSPANGGVAVGNGTYNTPEFQFADAMYWVGNACVNGCSGTTPTPAVSSIVQT